LLARERVICGGEYSPAGRKYGPVCGRADASWRCWATAGHGVAQLSAGGGDERWQLVQSAVSAAIARRAASYSRRYHRIDFPSWSGDFCSSPSSIMPVETSFQRRKSLADRVKTLFAAALVTSIASRC